MAGREEVPMQQLPIQHLPTAEPASGDSRGPGSRGGNQGDAGFDHALQRANDAGSRGEASAEPSSNRDDPPRRRAEDGPARRGETAGGRDGDRAPSEQAAPARTGAARGEGSRQAGEGQADQAPTAAARRTAQGPQDGPAGGLHPGQPGEARQGAKAQFLAVLQGRGGPTPAAQGGQDARAGRIASAANGVVGNGQPTGGAPGDEAQARLARLLAGGGQAGGNGSGTPSQPGGSGGSAGIGGLSLTALATGSGGQAQGAAAGQAPFLPQGSQGASHEALAQLLGGQGQARGERGGEAQAKAQAARLGAEAADGPAREGGPRLDASAGVSGNGNGSATRAADLQAARAPQASQSVPKAMVQVAREAADGQREVRLKLHPPHLGQVRVELQMTDNRVQAIFHVDNRQAASLLDGQMHQLRTALQDHQLELEGSQVHLGDSGSGGDPRQFGDDQTGDGGDRGWGRWRAFGGDEAGADGDAGGGGPAESARGLNLYA
jgi:hypothetical protein